VCVCVCVCVCVRVNCTFLLVPAVSVETRIMYMRMCICMHVCSYVCMYVCLFVCLFVCTYVCYSVVLVPGNPLGSDVTCHSVAVCGTPTRECDTTDLHKVYVRYELSSRTL